MSLWTLALLCAIPPLFVLARHAWVMRQMRKEWAWREQCIRATGIDPKTGKRGPSDAEIFGALDDLKRECDRWAAERASKAAPP